MEQHFRQSDALYVASTAITASINDALRTLELAKSVNPQAVTILGGVHATLCYEEVLTATAAVDFIICGDGETTLRELLQTLEDGGDPSGISGLAFRRNGVTIKTSLRIDTGNIDDLPTAWDLLEWQEYKYFILPNSRLGAISISRAGNCRRFRDPRKVLDEIIHLHETYAIDAFLLADEHPTLDRERWELLLDLLIERKPSIHLLMQTSPADIVRDRDIMGKYREAGIVHIYVGVLATDQDILNSGSNCSNVAEVKLALDTIHEHGIISEASFVVGSPDETKSSIENTLKFAQDCNPDNAQFLPLTPWPNDAAYDDEVKQHIRVHDYSKYNLIDPVIEPRQMSLSQVDGAIMDCYRRFYMGKLLDVITMKDTFKRDYLMRAMKLMMVNPFILKKLGMGPLGKVSAKIGDMMK